MEQGLRAQRDACRHRVVYRLVGGVYLMVVAAVQGNVLWLLNLLDACVRVLIGIAKSVEVTPDKLARRYPEVCSVLWPARHIILFTAALISIVYTFRKIFERLPRR